MTKLKTFSDKYCVCLLLVHHTRKLESEDGFDMISGTNGLLGVADRAFIMHKKKRTDNTAIMTLGGNLTIEILGTYQENARKCKEISQQRNRYNAEKPENKAFRGSCGFIFSFF